MNLNPHNLREANEEAIRVLNYLREKYNKSVIVVYIDANQVYNPNAPNNFFRQLNEDGFQIQDVGEPFTLDIKT